MVTKVRIKFKLVLIYVLSILIGGYIGLLVGQNNNKTVNEQVEEKIEQLLFFNKSASTNEQDIITRKMEEQGIVLDSTVAASVVTTDKINSKSHVIREYLPVTGVYSTRQKITKKELKDIKFIVDSRMTETAITALLNFLDVEREDISRVNLTSHVIEDNEVAFILSSFLTSKMKLLEFDGSYYLDDFSSGAIFRNVVFEGEGAGLFDEFKIMDFLESENVFKVNMSGVTALTRIMMRKLDSVNDPLYFSKKIGSFLADADLTHVSNEVSFKPDCSYSNTLFCSPPEFIETLKASGVDLVEITGNHNNDFGSKLNTQTIELYRNLGWGVVGGGLNSEDAAKPFVSNTKGSKLTFLAYNYPDYPNGGAISGLNKAGANGFDVDRIEKEIAAAKTSSDFVIVNVQYWECYAYPDGYVEFPKCDKPISEQEQEFKNLIDLGADMVVGSSAHQPQTYEIYKDKPIYYGLGNMYFDQTSWPGTERGIILTHYFSGGELLQTKLSPTVYGKDLQTRLMTDTETEFLLTRLKDARDD